MDPDVALETIRMALRELTDELDTRALGEHVDEQKVDALVETVKGLDQWLTTGGFLPAEWRHHKQFHRLGELIEQHHATDVAITYKPFDLPEGYVLVQLSNGTRLTYGIDSEGVASS